VTWFTPFNRHRCQLQHFHEEQLSKTRRSGHATSLLPVFRLTIYYCLIFWPLIHRTGLEQLPIMKLQLLYLDSTLNLKLNVILQKFLHYLLLSVDWHSVKTVIGRCHTPSFPLWHSILLQPPHHRRMWRGCFPFAGTCAPENETGQVQTLSSVHFWEWTKTIWPEWMLDR